MPDTRELEAAWQALSERERRSEEALRQRAAELEERSARVSALWEELSERSDDVGARDAAFSERERLLAQRLAEIEARERRAAEAEARVTAGQQRLRAPGQKEAGLRGRP